MLNNHINMGLPWLKSVSEALKSSLEVSTARPCDKEYKEHTVLRFLAKFQKKEEKRQYYLPEGARVYAVGDIHGRVDLLLDLHLKIAEDSTHGPAQDNIVVYLGDYVDRGMHIPETLDVLADGLPGGFKQVYLRGNHEAMMLSFLEDSSMLDVWMGIGGEATLMNYKINVLEKRVSQEGALEIQQELIDAMPERHHSFLHQLKFSYALGDYFFVHAGVRPGIELSKQDPHDLLWIRNGFLQSSKHFGARIVHGHSIAMEPEILHNRINVDTGAYATGVLSCAVIQNDQVRLLQTGR